MNNYFERMKNVIKIAALPALFFVLLVNTSCLTEEEKVERTLAIEMQELDEFLEKLMADGYDIDTTDLGVYYIVNEEGSGNYPQAGDTLSVEYIGAFTDGNVFDASANYWPDAIWTLYYKKQSIIPGFENALSIMKKGGEIDAIIPSTLGYGITGSGVIPPYTTLIFNIKLRNIKPVTEGS